MPLAYIQPACIVYNVERVHPEVCSCQLVSDFATVVTPMKVQDLVLWHIPQPMRPSEGRSLLS